MVGLEFYVLAALVFIGSVISICISYSVEKKAKLSDLTIARIVDIKFDAVFKELDKLEKEVKKLKDDKQAHG